MPGAVADAHAPPLRHDGEEGLHVLGRDLVVDQHHDRAAARAEVEAQFRLLEPVQRIEVEREERGDAEPQPMAAPAASTAPEAKSAVEGS